MSDAQVFGPLLDGTDVERALLDHLEAWLGPAGKVGTYVAALRRVKDPEQEQWPQGVSPLRDFTVRHAVNEKWPENQLPMLLAYCPGLAASPSTDGDGTVSAPYACTLTAIASGYDRADATALARLYASAALLAVQQHPSLGGFARDTQWSDLQNLQITRGVQDDRTLMGVALLFSIDVETIFDRTAGPAEPLEDPEQEPGLPLITEKSVDVGMAD